MAILSHSQNTLHLKCNSVDLTVENSIIRQTVVFLEQAYSQFIQSDEYFAIMFGNTTSQSECALFVKRNDFSVHFHLWLFSSDKRGLSQDFNLIV